MKKFHLMRWLCLAPVIVSMLTAPWANAQDAPATVDLQPNLEEGRSSRYEVWTRRTQTSIADGESASSDLEINGELVWRVDSVSANGSGVCTMKWDFIVATMTLPDDTQYHVDTRKGSGEPEAMYKLLRAMADVPLQVHVEPDGMVTRITGIEGIARRAPEGMSLPDEADYIENALETALVASAPKEGTVGEGWDESFVLNRELGKLYQDAHFELVGVEDIEGVPIANISVTSRLKFEPDLSDLPPEAPPITVRMTHGSQESQIMFDLSRHETVGRNTLEERNIEISIRLPQQTLRRQMNEVVQSQVLRISEE